MAGNNDDKYFKCDECGNVYEKNLSEEEAVEQLASEFPGANINECGIVCDDCYNEMMSDGLGIA